MPGSLLGNAVPRVEDPALLTGLRRYVDDLPIEGALHAHFVRSPIAHGIIARIDVAEALTQPGVVAVYTAEDLGLEPAAGFISLHPLCVRPPLAVGNANFVGDPVAVVIAETK